MLGPLACVHSACFLLLRELLAQSYILLSIVTCRFFLPLEMPLKMKMQMSVVTDVTQRYQRYRRYFALQLALQGRIVTPPVIP